MIGLLLLVAQAWALGGNDRLELALMGGQTVEGWFYRATPSSVVLSGGNRFTEVPLGVIVGATVNGSPWTVAVFSAEVERSVPNVPERAPRPAPWVAGAGSALWAGAGQAMIHDWRGAAAWSAVEVGLLGAGALAIHEDAGFGVLIPIIGLDLLFKGTSARDAARRARARRIPVKPIPPDLIDR